MAAAGFRLVMVTNQPDIARGRVGSDEVARQNSAVQCELGLDDVRMCPHDDADRCACRKPAAGMLLDAARDAGIDLAASIMVGDRWRDIEAGRGAGTRTVFIDHGYGERRADGADLVVRSLPEAVPYILGLLDGDCDADR